MEGGPARGLKSEALGRQLASGGQCAGPGEGPGRVAPNHTRRTPTSSPSGLETEMQSPGREVTFGRSRGHWRSDGLWSPRSLWPWLVLQSTISVFDLVARQDLKHFTQMNRMQGIREE